jgi:fermentation-respiration switch protein FrsA (DUF1100 family)
VARVQVPITFVHGFADRFIHRRDAQELFDAAHEPRQLVFVPAMAHAFGPAAIRPVQSAVSWSLEQPARVH